MEDTSTLVRLHWYEQWERIFEENEHAFEEMDDDDLNERIIV